MSLSFDDGYKEDLLIAKCLRRRNIKATFAIAIKNIGRELNKSDLYYLAKTGEIVSHSITHINLVKLSKINPSLAYSELWHSKSFLEKTLGIPIRGFAYPYGVYNSFVKKLVAKAGYEYARSIDLAAITPSVNDVYAIPVTMVDYEPTLLQLLKPLLNLRLKMNVFISRSLIKYLFSPSPLTHSSILKLMLDLLQEVHSYARQHNKAFSILLVFHSRRFNHESFKIFEKILDYINNNNSTMKVLTLYEYVRLTLYSKSQAT